MRLNYGEKNIKRHIYFATIFCLILASCQNHCGTMHHYLLSFVARSLALMKSHPKSSISAGLAGTCALGYGAFQFLREWKIKNEKKSMINRIRASLEKDSDPLSICRLVDNPAVRLASLHSTWGKCWLLGFRSENRNGKLVWHFEDEHDVCFWEIVDQNNSYADFTGSR